MVLVPHLGHDVGLGVGGLDAPSELPPELVVVDLGRDVQAPAVGPEPDPVLGHPHQVLADVRGCPC